MSDETDGTAGRTRRRVLGGLATIGAASAAAGAGTMALFQDTETSGDNTLAAGTLDLEVGNAGEFQLIHVEEAAPGMSDDQETAIIKNEGTVDGSLDFEIVSIRDEENGVNDPEAASPEEDDPEGESSGGPQSGELAENLWIRSRIVEANPDPAYLIGDKNGLVKASTLTTGERDLNVQIDAGDYATIESEYRIPEDAGNEIQSDRVVIDAKFHLNQEDSQ
ncbi:TasA family protein [Halorussus marinus]|uniref:TasA family protein n=1 Tax=Halorussus marinus TaxID=2505976 RepID=UPI001092E083|nr:TasA family protein [Halorussus marinus]